MVRINEEFTRSQGGTSSGWIDIWTEFHRRKIEKEIILQLTIPLIDGGD